MRVLHVIESVGTGAALHVLTLAAAQKASGDDVLVAAPTSRAWGVSDPAFASKLGEESVDVVEVPMHSLPVHPNNALAASKLVGVVRLFNPEVVHSHSTAAGAVARPVAWRTGNPCVHTPHGVRFAEPGLSASGLAALTLERMLARFTSRVVAVSTGEAEVLARAYPRQTIAVVPNCVAVDDGPVRPMPDVPRVVSVHRFVRQKDPELGVRVMAMVRSHRPDTEMVVIGDGPMKQQVSDLVARLDPSIRIDLATPGAEAIEEATVVLQTPRWEGLSYVTLEAMAAGRPVVACDVVGTRDVVVHGATGILFDRNDPEAGCAAVIRLLDDRSLTRAMGEEGRRFVRARFSLERMVEGIAEVYASVARR